MIDISLQVNILRKHNRKSEEAYDFLHFLPMTDSGCRHDGPVTSGSSRHSAGFTSRLSIPCDFSLERTASVAAASL